jgi:predicted Zn-dependent protease
MTEEATYLGKIDGLVYGDSPEDGYVRGRRFLHPGLGIGFEVPPGFTLVNTPERVLARGPGGSVIVLDRAPKPAAGDMATYLTRNWGRNLSLVGVESLDVNGYEAATGYTTLRDRDGRYDLRLVALRFDDGAIYRFIFATPEPLTDSLAVDLRRATYSFHRLTGEELASLRPQRIAVVVTEPGDTVASLAARMPFADWREERFRVLNGLGASQRLVSGRMVKLVVE